MVLLVINPINFGFSVLVVTSALRRMGAAITCSVITANMTSAGCAWETGNPMVQSTMSVPDTKRTQTLLMNQSMPKHEKPSRNICIIMNEYVDFLPVTLSVLLNVNVAFHCGQAFGSRQYLVDIA